MINKLVMLFFIVLMPLMSVAEPLKKINEFGAYSYTISTQGLQKEHLRIFFPKSEILMKEEIAKDSVTYAIGSVHEGEQDVMVIVGVPKYYKIGEFSTGVDEYVGSFTEDCQRVEDYTRLDGTENNYDIALISFVCHPPLGTDEDIEIHLIKMIDGKHAIYAVQHFATLQPNERLSVEDQTRYLGMMRTHHLCDPSNVLHSCP